MTRNLRIKGLALLTGLIMDRHLADLREKKAAQTATRQHIAALDQQAVAQDMPLATAAMVGLRYAAWADQRKMTLNVTLARQTASVLDAEAAARGAFARHTVMQGVLSRSARMRP